MKVKGSWMLLMFITSSLTVVIATAVESSLENDERYGLLLDAGSTSSKLKIYRWRPSLPGHLPQLKLIGGKKFKPPLSSYFGNEDGIRVYLQMILAWASKQIPEEKHSTTPFYVMGTAGLRFLPAHETYHILSSIQIVLGNATYNPFAPMAADDVSVLSGEEEAIFAWVAINYLRGFFDGDRPPYKYLGLLEMGGGSTQIAFIPREPIYAEEFQVRLSGRLYSVYVQSYLQYGSNGIKVKVADHLRKQQSNYSHVDDPCSLHGDESIVKFGDKTSVLLHGTGSPSACLQVLEEILKPAEGVACQPKPCSIGRVYQPPIGDQTFYATQAFTYAPRNFGVIGPNGELNITTLLEVSIKYCQQSLDDAIKNPNVRTDYASADCLMGLYVPSLFKAYGFSPSTENIRMTSKIGSLKIEWAMGAMLIKLSNHYDSTNGIYSTVKKCNSTCLDNSAGTINITSMNYLILLSLTMMFKKRTNLTLF